MTPEEKLLRTIFGETRYFREDHDRETKRAYNRKRYLANREKEIARTCARQKANPAKNAAKTIRHKIEPGATPEWLCPLERWLMEKFYHESRARTEATEVIHHVHHIVPLKGENEYGQWVVSGLNVPWNLQVMTGAENWSKGRRTWISRIDHDPNHYKSDWGSVEYVYGPTFSSQEYFRVR